MTDFEHSRRHTMKMRFKYIFSVISPRAVPPGRLLILHGETRHGEMR